LVLDKCFWYFFDQTWNNGKWTYKTNAQAPADHVVADEMGKPIAIPRLEANKAQHTLGV